MDVMVSCPACSLARRVPEEREGREVHCVGCGECFVARRAEGLAARPRDDERPAPSWRRESGRGRQRREEVPPGSGSLWPLLIGAGGVVSLFLIAGGVVAGALLSRPVPPPAGAAAAAGVADDDDPDAADAEPGAPPEGRRDPAVPAPKALPEFAALKDPQFGDVGRGEGVTYLRLVSSPGEAIGRGQSYTYRGAEVWFGGTSAPIAFSAADWRVGFSGPTDGRGHRRPGVGTYRDARRWPFNDDAPGLSFTGRGRGCNQVAGHFVVWELAYVNGRLARAAIDFVHYCEGGGPPLYGRLRYNSTFR
jgi:hypothetical protein